MTVARFAGAMGLIGDYLLFYTLLSNVMGPPRQCSLCTWCIPMCCLGNFIVGKAVCISSDPGLGRTGWLGPISMQYFIGQGTRKF